MVKIKQLTSGQKCVLRRVVFENQATGNWQLAISRNEPPKCEKKGFDRSVTGRSNGTLVFVCNKTPSPGWGYVEETGIWCLVVGS